MPKYFHHDLARWEVKGGSHILESVHLTHTQPGMPSSEKEARRQSSMEHLRSLQYEEPGRRTHLREDLAVQDKWKILSYVDLHANAAAEVQHALSIAEALRGDLTILHLQNERSKRSEPIQWPATAEAADRDLDVRRVDVTGTIRGTFTRYADDLGADLITVPAGYPWWQRLWRTSAADAVAASTDRPVCVTNVTSPAPANRVKSILSVLPLDGTDESVISFSEALAERCDTTLVFLHVLPEVSEALLYEVMDGDRPLSRGIAEQRMREAMLDVERPHLTAFAMGSMYRSVARVAKEHNADLVITGRPKGAPSAFDAGAFLSKVTCPVISVAVGSRSPGWSAVTPAPRS